MTIITAVIALITFLLAVVFFFYGKIIMRRLPPVARFLESKKFLTNTKIGYKKVPAGQTLTGFCKRQADEVMTWGFQNAWAEKFEKMATGSVITLLHYKEDALNRTIRELRYYAFAIMVFGGAGALSFVRESNFDPRWGSFLLWITNHPFQYYDFAKMALAGILVIRLALEVMSINEIFEE